MRRLQTTIFSNYKKTLILKPETGFEEVIKTIQEGHNSFYVDAARAAGKGSQQYEKIKASVPSFTPHGCFTGAKNNNLVALSGLLYLDIDDQEINLETLKLIPSLFACWRSISGTGYSLLFKGEGYTAEEINLVIADIATEYSIPYDDNAKALNRAVCISADPEIYFNADAETYHSNKEYSLTSQETIQEQPAPEVKKISKKKKGTSKESKRTFMLLQDIPVYTGEPYFFAEDEVYHIFDEPRLVMEDLFRRAIPKGKRYSVLSITASKVIAIYAQNGFSEEQAYREFLTFNKFCQPEPLAAEEMQRIFRITLQKFKAGEMKVPCVLRHGVTNPNMPEQVRKGAPALIRSEITRKKTIALITEAVNKFHAEGKKVTQKEIAKHIGMSLRTVKEYWKEVEIKSLTNKQVDLVYKIAA